MPDTPSSDPAPHSRRERGTPEPVRSVNPATVVGGAVLGFAGSWVLFALVVMAMYTAYGDSTSTGQTVIAFTALLALPVVGLALMVSPRTRHAGAGLLMGVAIGSVVGAGICGAVIGSGM